MYSVILILPNTQLRHLPALATFLGLEDIVLSVALGPDASTATHAAGHLWNAQPIITDMGEETLDWSDSGLTADVVETLIEQARLKVIEPGSLLLPHTQFQALLEEMELVLSTV